MAQFCEFVSVREETIIATSHTKSAPQVSTQVSKRAVSYGLNSTSASTRSSPDAMGRRDSPTTTDMTSDDHLLEQAHKTAHDYMMHAKSDIDELFGDGYAIQASGVGGRHRPL
jgi:hypothetical protein